MRWALLIGICLASAVLGGVSTAVLLGFDDKPGEVTVTKAGDEPTVAGGIVASVVDGTRLALADGRTIRLLQTDAPRPGQDCYGQQAADELRRLAPPGSTVHLLGDPLLGLPPDSGDAYVVVDGLFVNNEMIKSGAAVPYFAPAGRRGIYASTFMKIATKAKRKEVGMWRACPTAQLDPLRGAVTGPS